MSSTPLPAAPEIPAGASGIPEPIERAHRWALQHWPASTRKRVVIWLVIIGVALMILDAIARLLGSVVHFGDFAYLGLIVVCWAGAGGALVPIPGTRALSWVMIVRQGTEQDPVAVAVVAALAMAVGQTSYFVATRLEQERLAHGGQRLHLPKSTDASTAAEAPDEAATAAKTTKSKRPPSRVVTSSKALVSKGEVKVKQGMTTHPGPIVFLLCVVPNPLTRFATMSAAATGVRFWRFFVASALGFLVMTGVLVIGGQAVLALLGVA